MSLFPIPRPAPGSIATPRPRGFILQPHPSVQVPIPSHKHHHRSLYLHCGPLRWKSSRESQYRTVQPSALNGGGFGNGNGNGGVAPPTNTQDPEGDGDGDNDRLLAGNPHWWIAFSILMTGYVAWRSIIRDSQASKFSENEPVCEQVSIIIPTLNESKIIADTVAYLQCLDPPPHEIIVVDANSKDGTARTARKAGATVVRSVRGRARQMNAGAGVSIGDIVMFVHCDSRPPKDAILACRTVLRDPRNVLGGFTTTIEHDGRILWLPTIHQFVSTYYAPALFAPLAFLRGLRCMFGDQSLFCRQKDFKRVGGFDTRLPIMEDADLCVRLHRGGLASGRAGREVQLGLVNRTSGRRIGPWGVWKSTVIQFTIAWAWWRGASPERLWQLYETMYTDAFR